MMIVKSSSEKTDVQRKEEAQRDSSDGAVQLKGAGYDEQVQALQPGQESSGGYVQQMQALRPGSARNLSTPSVQLQAASARGPHPMAGQVQMSSAGRNTDAVHEAASQGIQGSSSELPHPNSIHPSRTARSADMAEGSTLRTVSVTCFRGPGLSRCSCR